jgi:hypothetical protein
MPDIPDIFLSKEEAEKLRDRINADEAKSTETLSTISRTLATGLALITYTFLIQKDQSAFLLARFETFRYASILGVLSLAADALQYAFASIQVRRLRYRIKEHIRVRQVLTLQELDRFTRNWFYYLRDAMFWFKLLFAAAGTIIVVLAISSKNGV